MLAMPHVAMRIEQLRQYRARPQRDVSIAGLIRSAATQASRTNRHLGQLIELWEQHVPAELAAKTTITALRGGVLHITVESSSVIYELDRLLREGLEQQLRSSYQGNLMRVRLRAGSPTA